MRRTLIIAALCAAVSSANQAMAACDDTGDTGSVAVGDEDCDNDGWTKADGDCNDNNDEVNPGKTVDRCDDSDDNDCDGYFNEECEAGFARGTLLGGSACQDNSSLWLLLAPLPLFIRRRGKRS